MGNFEIKKMEEYVEGDDCEEESIGVVAMKVKEENIEGSQEDEEQ